MKKIMMIFLALIIILSAKDVLAQDQYKLTLEKQNGIYYSRRGKNYNDDSNIYSIYKFGDIFAYCIEPGKQITTYNYVGEDDFVDLGFSEELKEKLELIGYYGRDYPGHDNVRYSMAAQALIWELTGVDTVTFWTEKNEKGEEININKERNEIMNLVNNHRRLPNFNSEYTGSLKKEIKIKDTNNVLNSYEVIKKDDQEVYIENNTLVIMPNKIGVFDIELRKKNYNEYKTIIFVGKGDNSSQKIARLHFTKEIKTSVRLNIEGIRLGVYKVNDNNEPVKVANIMFKIHDLTRNKEVCSQDCIFKTDDNGYFITEPLEYGEYEIEELEDQIVEGYSWNKNKLHVVINDETKFNYTDELHNYFDVFFANTKVMGTLEINKKGEEVEFINNSITYNEVDLANISFSVYDKNDELVDTIITDGNGKANSSNLELGKYYLVEDTKLENYLEQEKIPFEIKQENQYQETISVNLTIKNILKKGTLEFTKEDLTTGEGIPNTIIEIYDINDNLLFTKETDELGKVIINELPIGKYYIIEKEANSLYMIINEKVFFEIKEDGEIVKAKMTNEKIEIIITKTGTKETIIAHIIFGICFLTGLIGMRYERKNY